MTQKIAPVEDYDQIVLLMEGEVLASGTHRELLRHVARNTSRSMTRSEAPATMNYYTLSNAAQRRAERVALGAQPARAADGRRAAAA